MNGFWLVSYVVLWVLILGAALVILALAREIEALHKRLEALQKFLSRTDWGAMAGSGQKQKGTQLWRDLQHIQKVMPIHEAK